MAEYGISTFWRPQFAGAERPEIASPQAGWSALEGVTKWFIEPKLTKREDYWINNPEVFLLAAPGAVGKSTLARNISAATGLMYIDLASTATVGGNFVSGGLVRLGGDVPKKWHAGALGLAIDALDEARLRVTEQSYQDFIDMCCLSRITQ